MNLTAERLDRGLSVHEAAQRMGVARGSLVKAEAGLRVSPSVAKKIADFYGVKVTDLPAFKQEREAA